MSDASVIGQWEPVQYRFANLPVHLALLHTGKVLGFGGSGNDPANLQKPHDAELFDPATGVMSVVEQTLDGDLFCAGHAFLADGSLLVAGGTHKYDGTLKLFGAELPPFSGLDQAYLFDPVAEHWVRQPDMKHGRWYPSLVQLGDNSCLAFAGFSKGFPWVLQNAAELFLSGPGWLPVKRMDRWLPLYPRLHLLPDGRVFYGGAYNTHYVFPFFLWNFPTAALDVRTGTWTQYGLPKKAEREEGATVLLPLKAPDYRARIMITGGGKKDGVDPTAITEIIDMSDPAPAWREVQPMAHARYYCYAALLPDGNVLALGGKRGERRMLEHDAATMHHHGQDLPHDDNAILECELFDSRTETWSPAAAMTVDRVYHSGAMLLPDGRVLVAGSNPMRTMNELRIEIYHPPYLFKGSRPVITALPPHAAHGDTIEMTMEDAEGIDDVVLIRPISTTHCFSTEQRLVHLEIGRRDGARMNLAVPSNPNVLPPGYYMTFALRADVPSVARFIRIS